MFCFGHIYEAFFFFIVGRYYHGPTVVQSTDYFSSEEVVNAMRAVENEVLASVPRLHKV